MLPIQLLLILTTSASVGSAILEKVGQADLEAVRIRLEAEKARRLLLENDVEVLMLQVEKLKRGFSQISKDNNASSGNLTPMTPSIAFTVTLFKHTTQVSEQTVIFDNVKINEGNCYDSSTGRFRAPIHGLYIFSVTVLKLSDSHVHLFIMKDNVEVGRVFSGPNQSDSGSVTVVTVMDKGQVAYCKEMPGSTQTMHEQKKVFLVTVGCSASAASRQGFIFISILFLSLAFFTAQVKRRT